MTNYTVAQEYGSVTRSPDWGGDVLIVGGGPSAKTFDYSQLRYQKVLAINDMCSRLFSNIVTFRGESTFSRLPAFFTEDRRLVLRNRAWLTSYPGEKYVSLPLETWLDCGGIEGVTYLKLSFREGLSEDPGTINSGGNSGFGAIGLAYLMGARRIFLIGYDMDPETNDLYAQWILRFRSAVPQLRAAGVDVWNLNLDSYVDAFPFGVLSDFKPSGGPGGYKPPPEVLGTSLGALNVQETSIYGIGEGRI